MEDNSFLGLVKFYRNEEFLDNLLDGGFHCTPPEIYRLDKQEGVSDKVESCAYSYRKERDDSPIVTKLDDVDLGDLIGFTAHNGTEKDAWMHCWFTLRSPSDQAGLDQLKRDVARMKKQFGNHYAFLPPVNLKPLIFRLNSLSTKESFCGEVGYSGDKSKWGNLCKSLGYSYQREYRFLFGECSPSEKDFYVFDAPKGFGDLIYSNSDVKLQSEDGSHVWFDLQNTYENFE